MNSHELDMRGTKKLREVVEREYIPKVKFFCNAEVQHPDAELCKKIKNLCRGEEVNSKALYRKPYEIDMSKIPHWQECGKTPIFEEKNASTVRNPIAIPFDKNLGKPSKKIPLEREWLEFDPELDKKYYWSNVIRVVNGEVTVTPELREVK